MHKISFLVVATALILTAGIGGWTVLTTSDVKAAAKATNNDDFPGRTPIHGGLFVMPPVY
jgi:hypothetical protein